MTAVAANPCSVKVREVMSSPVHTVQMDDFIHTVRQLFEKYRCHHVVVMERKKVYGVVSDRDVLRVMSPFVGNESMERTQDANTMKRRVHQIMSRQPITIRPDEYVVVAAHRMHEEHISSLPVVDPKGELVGIVTTRDILRWTLSACPLQTATAGNP